MSCILIDLKFYLTWGGGASNLVPSKDDECSRILVLPLSLGPFTYLLTCVQTFRKRLGWQFL